VLGKVGTDIEGLVIYSVGRTPGPWEGFLVALDKETGEVVWEISSGNYTWSSPVALYTEDGRSYLFLANASGVCRLVEGATGEVLQTLSLKQTVEASPVVYGNMVILGTREGVYGIRVD
jgi:outer membrane protein assembly factor BamB